MSENIKKLIAEGDVSLGVEFGSTRIKAILTTKGANVVAQSDFEWENQLVDGIFSYDLKDVWVGLQDCYAKIAAQVKAEYDVELTKIGAMGFSAMMHGYIAFDSENNLLVPFRTWRNTITEQAADQLSEAFGFNIPQRWTVAHLYQAILKNEPHIPQVDFVTTLAGYVHWCLTGNKVVGVGEASGIFPIDETTMDYNAHMAAKFDQLTAEKGFCKKLCQVFPKVLTAGDNGGTLTKEGALLIDPTGKLQAGTALCPPEGDAGTGMVATNSILPKTGNISAGTSIFAMIVLEKSLSNWYKEIDMVTTPVGHPVAMVHCNTCTSDINGYVKMFHEFAKNFNPDCNIGEIYNYLYNEAAKGDYDCGGLIGINYFAGEPVVGVEEGVPMFLRNPQGNFTLRNFMRSHIYATFACVKVGLDMLFRDENVPVEKLLGHGGLFKVPGVAQQMMASALDTEVQVTTTASEGGAWGMAILAEFMKDKAEGQSLVDYLDNVIFADAQYTSKYPVAEETAGYNAYIENYKKAMAAEKAAAAILK
ncbi:MAG: ATPase [Oscillospiraceae bacterium]|nr:ATPase [Oscillospiraceae bacterium]